MDQASLVRCYGSERRQLKTIHPYSHQQEIWIRWANQKDTNKKDKPAVQSPTRNMDQVSQSERQTSRTVTNKKYGSGEPIRKTNQPYRHQQEIWIRWANQKDKPAVQSPTRNMDQVSQSERQTSHTVTNKKYAPEKETNFLNHVNPHNVNMPGLTSNWWSRLERINKSSHQTAEWHCQS